MSNLKRFARRRIFIATLSFGVGAVVFVLLTGSTTISDDILAALIGNAGLIAATLITITATARFTARQFKHERIEKAKDRALEIKKELLIDAVRGAQLLVGSIASVSNLERSVVEIGDAFQEGCGKLFAGAPVASVSSAKAGTNLVRVAGPLMMKCLTKRWPVESVKTDVQLNSKFLEQRMTDNENLITLQRDAIAASDENKARKLQPFIDGGSNLAKELMEERDLAQAQLDPLRNALTLECATASQKLTELIADFITEVRRDIGVGEGDSDEFRKSIAMDPEPMSKSLDDLIKTINE